MQDILVQIFWLMKQDSDNLKNKHNFWFVIKNILHYISIGKIHYVFDEICC